MHSEEDYVLFFFFFCLWKFLCYEMVVHKVVVQRVKVQLQQPRMLHIHVENRSYLPFPLC